MDLFADPALKDETSPFVELLWERGNAFEKEVIANLNQPFWDLSECSEDTKEHETTAAMVRQVKLIYRGRISKDGLRGDPDILRLEDDKYVPIDIKSGSGEEGGGEDDDGKPKTHYAVQLALYADVLERKGLSAGRKAYIWDIHGKEVLYDLNLAKGPRSKGTLWEEYLEVLEQAKEIIAQIEKTLPAFSSKCKECHWYTTCLQKVRQSNDLTLIPGLGRSRRDTMLTNVQTVKDLAKADLARFVSGKKTVFPGIGMDSLETFQRRAQLLSAGAQAKPYLKAPLTLPKSDIEVFFDIEVDPMRDICYLHGSVERRGQDNQTERFIAFYADDPTPAEEEKAFRDAWAYFKTVQTATIYYYSKYERTIWRKLQKKYPTVATEAEIEALFDPQKSIDLYYDVVLKATEWPTNDHSIKTLAKYLGFAWRDTHPSGAASIEWYHRWVESKDQDIKKRILDYNEDDCRATRVLLDGLKVLNKN
jgi:predicted RecB family nuclease